MIFNQTEKEERAYLMDIIALLAANIEQMDKAIEDKSKDVMEHKLYLWENLSELDRAEKSAVRQIVTQQVAASESLVEKKKRYRKMMAIPYFGRIDFQEKGQPEVLPLYIGIHSFFNPPNHFASISTYLSVTSATTPFTDACTGRLSAFSAGAPTTSPAFTGSPAFTAATAGAPIL